MVSSGIGNKQKEAAHNRKGVGGRERAAQQSTIWYYQQQQTEKEAVQRNSG